MTPDPQPPATPDALSSVPGGIQGWLALLSGQLPGDEASALLSDGRLALSTALEAPSAEDDIIDLFRRHLLATRTTTSWAAMLDAVTGYVGVDAAYYLVWALRDPDGDMALHTEGQPRIREVVGRIHGLFSQELEEAWGLWLEKPTDWRRVSWEIYLDQIAGGMVLEFTITRNDGEMFTITSNENSLLNLADRILAVLGQVPLRGLREDVIGGMQDRLHGLLEAVQAEAPEAPEVTADVADGPGADAN